ncbi:MAG: hypothetical protein M0041_00435 [Nitrospiraceae bacterium]|nr:hypothetical protein [Nitrospiraceae bacterium]
MKSDERDLSMNEMSGNLETLYLYSMGKVSRKEAREALGVDGFHLNNSCD